MWWSAVAVLWQRYAEQFGPIRHLVLTRNVICRQAPKTRNITSEICFFCDYTYDADEF